MKLNLAKTIKADFKKWKPVVKAAGYDLNLQDSGNLLCIRTKNTGLKHEIKYRRKGKEVHKIILTAYNDHADIVKDWFQNVKGLNRPIKKWDYDSDKCATTDFQTIEHWLELADELKDIEGIVKRVRGINEDGFFANVVIVWRKAFETGMTAMIDRGSSLFDKVDHIIALNNPLAKDSWREHIVPIIVLIYEAIRMFKAGNSDAEIAVMLQQNLFVYHITKKQARYLDVDLGLRRSMPKGWKFGDSVWARLDAGGIDYNKKQLDRKIMEMV